jgi:hypothetical protein
MTRPGLLSAQLAARADFKPESTLSGARQISNMPPLLPHFFATDEKNALMMEFNKFETVTG